MSLLENIDYSRLPDYMQGAARRYVENRLPPGHFLTAVLCNNLVDAAMHADSTNRECLYDYACWLYNDLPGNCWGDPETVAHWLAGTPFEADIHDE